MPAFHSGQPHVLRATTKKTMEVIPIVPVTAMPYAAARFTECTNREHAEFHAAIRDRGGISAALHAFAG